FNPETVIRYGLHQQSTVELAVYNVLGQRVRTLVEAEQKSGRYEVVWDGLDEAGRSVASGVYVYQLRAGGFLASRTMLLVR
ncbi:MAG: FlgD immunoglobulin-like domain containing protein, partial [Pseudomonadales bacterium]